MQHAPSIHDERVGIWTRFNPQCKVLLKFLFQTLLQVAGSNKLAFTAEEWRIIDTEEHTHSRLVNLDWRKGLRIFKIGYGITYFKAFKSDNCTYVTAIDGIHLGFSQAVKDHQLLDFLLLEYIISLAEGNVHT